MATKLVRSMSTGDIVAKGLPTKLVRSVSTGDIVAKGLPTLIADDAEELLQEVDFNSSVANHIKTTAKVVTGTAVGSAIGGAATAGVASAGLQVAGFTAVGPAAGSYAASWMSSIAIANGGCVQAGSLYSVLQSTAMTGVLVGAPLVVASGAVLGGVGVATWMLRRRSNR